MDKISFIRDRLGAFPSPADPRHLRVRSPLKVEVEELPEEYDGLLEFHDLENWYAQGDLGFCVGWAGSIAMEVTNMLLDLEPDDLSAGWLYVRSREYAHVPPGQEGSTNLGLMKALNKEGAVTEECCRTDTTRPFDDYDPCENAMEEAGNYAVDSYWYVNPFVTDFQAAIYGVTHAAPYEMPDGSPGKIPLVSAYPVYESYGDAMDGGIVPMPEFGERLLGGHSSVIRGWKVIDGETYLINSNSWGRVGDDGTFYLPSNYPFYEGFLIHNGPPTEPTPSPCPLGNGVARSLNWILRNLPRKGRKGRFQYVNPIS